MSETVPTPKDAKPPQLTLPPEISSLATPLIAGQELLGVAPYDVSEQNKLSKYFAVLTDKQLLLIEPGKSGGTRAISLDQIEDSHVEEGVGIDYLRIVSAGRQWAVCRYTRRNRREMIRLNRRLLRRIPAKAAERAASGMAADIGWLEAVERKAEFLDKCPKCRRQIPAYAEGVCPKCLNQRKTLTRLFEVAKPYRKTILLSLGLTLINAIIVASPVKLQKMLVDDALIGKGLNSDARLHNLMFFGGALVAVILASEILGGWRTAMLSTVGTKVARDLRHNVYAHLQALSLKFFNKRRTGSLITRVTNDTDRLWEFIVFGSVDIIRDSMLIIVLAAFMFSMNWRLALVAMIPIPVVAILTYVRGRAMHRMWSRLWTYWSRMSAVVGDAVPGMRVIKAFAAEDREVARFDERSDQYTKYEQEANKLWWQLQPIVSGMMRLGGLMVLVVGGYMLIKDSNGTTTYGDIVAITGAVWQFYGPIMALANSNRMVTRAATSAQRVFEVLDTPPDIHDRNDSYRPAKLIGKIEFRNVGFSYEGAQPALRNVSLTIEPGEMIGLCGPSGAGKSTFVNLIPRFYDVTEGQILIDGVDVRDYDVRWLRRQIGMVLQEPYLFHGTIAENIRYADPNATPRQVMDAARAANAHDFIVGFPDGYDTMVGERGQSLSGGERQRISIARAILAKPGILILDEATSSVDTETEKQIQQALDRLVAGRSVIAIAHRLSTLTAANRLVVLDKGKVSETGTHAELEAKEGGIYAKLVKTQRELGSLVAVVG